MGPPGSLAVGGWLQIVVYFAELTRAGDEGKLCIQGITFLKVCRRQAVCFLRCGPCDRSSTRLWIVAQCPAKIFHVFGWEWLFLMRLSGNASKCIPLSDVGTICVFLSSFFQRFLMFQTYFAARLCSLRLEIEHDSACHRSPHPMVVVEGGG